VARKNKVFTDLSGESFENCQIKDTKISISGCVQLCLDKGFVV